MLRLEIAGVLGEGDAGGEIDAVGSVVERLGKVVSGETRDAVQILNSQGRLQRAVGCLLYTSRCV